MKERMYSNERLALMAIIALILVAILLTGCQTLKGVTGDTGWMLTKLSDNINTEKE